MLNRKLSMLLLTFLIGQVKAQETPKVDTLQRYLRNFAVEHPVFLNQYVPERMTRIELNGALTTGDFKKAQDADKSKHIGFNSEGSVTIKDTRLWGNFSYQKAIEDSTRFGHITRNDEFLPLYFASYGKNHYERTSYKIQARGQRYFAQERITLFAGLDYSVADHFSNNDPRGSIDEMGLDVNLGLGVKINKKWLLGLEGRYGYGQENFEIAFKNSIYQNSPDETPYLNYLVKGLGWALDDYLTRTLYQNDYKQRKGYLFSQYKSNFGTFYGRVGYGTANYKYSQLLTTEERKADLMDFDVKRLGYTLFWTYTNGDRNHLVKIDGESVAGKDYDILEMINNYTYYRNNVMANYVYTVYGTRTDEHYGLSAGLEDLDRKDGGTNTRLKSVRFNASLSADYSSKLKSKSEIQYGLSLGWTKALETDWTLMPINNNRYHDYVFDHDLSYYGSDYMSGSIRVGYKMPIHDAKYMVKIQASSSLQYASNIFEGVSTPTRMSWPGHKRTNSNLRLEFMF